MEKTFVFHKTSEGRFPKTMRIEKKESELTQPQKDLLLGELIQKWNNNTKENQHRFTQMLLDEYKDASAELFFKKLKENKGNNQFGPSEDMKNQFP